MSATNTKEGGLTMKRVLLAAVLTVVGACGGGDGGGSPTSPTPPTNPTPQTFTLAGGISETAPTTANKIPGAIVTFVDGSNAGKTATADGAGNYRITGLNRGGFTVRVEAPGYDAISSGVEINADVTRNFTLRPVFQPITETLSGDVSGGSPTCGTFLVKPCRTFTVSVHHGGTLEARLQWGNRSNDLDLELWSGTNQLADSHRVGTTEEFISSGVSAGSTYQLRVIYYSGSTVQPFTLRVSRPN